MEESCGCNITAISKGEKGDSGAQGPIGPQGPPGTSLDAWLLNGNTVTSEKYFGTNANYDIPLYTNSIKRGVFDKNGNFGFGVSTGLTARLTVKGVDFNPLTSNFEAQDSLGTVLFNIKNGGNVGIGVASPAAKLHIASLDRLGSNFIIKAHDNSDLILFDVSNNGDVYRDNQRFISSIVSNMTFLRMGFNTFNNFDPTTVTSQFGAVGVGMDVFSSATNLGGNVGFGSGVFSDPGYTATRNIGFGSGIGANVTSGTQNLLFGYAAGGNFTSGSYNIQMSHEFVSGNYSNTLAFGHNGTIESSNAIQFGGVRQYYSVKFGTDVDNGGFTASSFVHTIASVAVGVNNLQGWDYDFKVSGGTGNQDGGKFRILSSPGGASGSARNAYYESFTVSPKGLIGVNMALPKARFHNFGIDSTTNVNQRLEPVTTVTQDITGGTITSTDNSANNVEVIAVPTNSVLFIESIVVNRKVSGAGVGVVGQGSAVKIAVSVQNIAGTLTMETQSVVYPAGSNIITGCTVNFVVSGTNVNVVVRGVLNDTIKWNSISKINTIS